MEKQKLDLDRTVTHFENLLFLSMAKQEKSIRTLKDAARKRGKVPYLELQHVQDDAVSLSLLIERYRTVEFLQNGGPAFDWVDGKDKEETSV